MHFKSYAKINLILNILGKRSDGYHNISTVFQHIDLADSIELNQNNHNNIIIKCNIRELENESNLCYKAAKLLKENSGINKGVTIRLNKKIPLGSGLSGGSSNAAVVMKGLNKIWSLGLQQQELMRVSQKIGMDVGFHLIGGTCLGSGRGEIIKKLKDLDRHYVVLVYPGFEISSKRMYASLKYDLIAKKNNELKLADFLHTYDLSLLNNDFEYFVEKLYPEIMDIKNKLGPNALMSGSGSSVFGIYKTKHEAETVFQSLKKGYRHIFFCMTIPA